MPNMDLTKRKGTSNRFLLCKIIASNIQGVVYKLWSSIGLQYNNVKNAAYLPSIPLVHCVHV
jgi:hypothetical protein